eukprot:1159436-Pelagomonas_calceolata.AAC.4
MHRCKKKNCMCSSVLLPQQQPLKSRTGSRVYAGMAYAGCEQWSPPAQIPRPDHRCDAFTRNSLANFLAGCFGGADKQGVRCVQLWHYHGGGLLKDATMGSGEEASLHRPMLQFITCANHCLQEAQNVRTILPAASAKQFLLAADCDSNSKKKWTKKNSRAGGSGS